MGQASWILGNGVKPAGGGLARFDTYASLPTTTNVGDEVLLKNPLSPTGYTRMYWTGTLWAPVDGQVLYNSLSRAQLDSVTGLAAGVVTEIWTSPVLPDWYFADGMRNEMIVRASLFDGSSTASVSMMAYISGSASSNSDVQQSMLGYSASANTFEAGIPDGFAGVAWRDGVNMKSRGGQLVGTPSSTATLVTRNIGTYVLAAMRVRLRVIPGATTNQFRPYGARIVAGGIEA